MADNTVLNAGSGGDTIATDDVAGTKYQRVKLVDGTNDSTTGIPGDATNGLDVDVTRETATVADGGSLPGVVKIVGGYDGTNAQVLSTDSSGRLVVVDGGGSLTVDGTVSITGSVTVANPDTQYTEGDTDSTITGMAILWEDAGDTLSTVNTTKRLPVNVQSSVTLAALPAGTNTIGKVDQGAAGAAAWKVDGSAVTQPVSASALPLPSGASTSAKQPALGTAGTASTDVLTVQGITSMTALKVDGSGVTQPVSASSLPLPTGAATAAKQPALGTAGGASADVLSVQGVASMTALKVDGSAVTHPVSVAAVVHVDDNSGSLTVDAPVGTPLFSTPTPSTTGGWSPAKFAAQTTTVQTVKGSAGTFGGYYVYNPNATVSYLQVFDVSGAVTLGTTAPTLIFGIPATSAANLEITCGVNMANAIKLACTTTATGLTAPSTGLDLTVIYK